MKAALKKINNLYEEQISVIDEICKDESSLLDLFKQGTPDMDEIDEFIDKREMLLTKLNDLGDDIEIQVKQAEGKKFDEVNRIDDIKKELSVNVKKASEKAKVMQELEQHIKTVLTSFFEGKKKEVREGRVGSKVAMNYYKVQNNSSFVDSFYMDSKK